MCRGVPGHREAVACSAANAFKVGARASSIYCTPNALLLLLPHKVLCV